MKKEILIAGAGPSGLSMAIFLNALGYQPRIIDKKPNIGPYSKALAINPRSLQILKPYGLTDRFLNNGRKMEAINIWKDDKFIYKNDFTKIKHAYPFMLVQTQKESEEILLEEALNRNINIEYNTALSSLQKTNQRYIANINSNQTPSSTFDFIIGADGGQSVVRQQASIQFDGFKYDEEWELYDIELDTPVAEDEGHILIFSEGCMVMIRLKKNVWRIAGNLKNLIGYLPKNTSIGNIIWESKFRIHHKVAQSLTNENIVLLGDAAHLHSPVGAKGMNLGIEDAFIASQLIHKNKLHTYNQVRRKHIKKTVKQINNMTMGLAGHSASANFIRNRLELLKVFFPFIMPHVRKFIMGL